MRREAASTARSRSASSTLSVMRAAAFSSASVQYPLTIATTYAFRARAAGLAAVQFTGGRLQRKEVKGVVFIDDSYNANPDSMKAAVDTFAALKCEGRKFIVAGGMAELGATSEEAHARIGKIASQSGVEFLVSVGEKARAVTAGLNGGSPAMVAHFDSQQSCAVWLKSEARAGDMVLVKGSRSSAMEKVIEEFSQES